MAYTDQLVTQLLPDQSKKRSKDETLNLLEANHYKILRKSHAYGIELFMRLLNHLSMASLICVALFVLQMFATDQVPFGTIFDLEKKTEQQRQLYFLYDALVCLVYVIAVEGSNIYLSRCFHLMSRDFRVGVSNYAVQVFFPSQDQIRYYGYTQ